jgi:hypothetical protein
MHAYAIGKRGIRNRIEASLRILRLAKLLKRDGVSVYAFDGGNTINNGRSHKYR